MPLCSWSCRVAQAGGMILFFDLVLARSIIIIIAVDVVVHCYLVVGTHINFPVIVLPN